MDKKLLIFFKITMKGKWRNKFNARINVKDFN